MLLSHSMPSARNGAALLEALVALTILATAAASIVAFATDSARTVRHARDAEIQVRRASALLDAIALWPREDLDRHLGQRQEGPFRLYIARVMPALYLVVLSDSSGGRELLRTTIYRPEDNLTGTAHAAP